MSGGGYRGGSTVLRVGKGSKISPRDRSDRIEDILDDRRAGVKPGGRRPKKKNAALRDDAPGLHVLPPEERWAVMEKVRKSRQISEVRKAEKERLDRKRRDEAFTKFVADMQKREPE